MAFSPDSKTVATASDDRTVRLWDAFTGQELASLEGHTGLVSTVAFRDDGKVLASAGAAHDGTGEVYLWSAVAPAKTGGAGD